MRAIFLITRCIVLLFVVVALASPCLADNTIYACTQKNTGSTRILVGSVVTQCLPDEIPISWNITGPQGPTGSQGLPGVANGISAAAHAHIGADGTLISGVNFLTTVNHPSPSPPAPPGIYSLFYEGNIFTQTPDCTVSISAPEFQPVGTCYISQSQTGQGGVTVFCTDSNGNLADRDFYLVCVQ